MSNLVKLSELCTKITDGSHYSPEGVETGYPMFSVKDMRKNGFSYDDCKYISEEEYKKMCDNGCKPEVNDILIAKDGSYLKHVFVITEDKKEAVLSSIGILKPDTSKVNPYYIKYYLSSDFVKNEVSKKYVSGSALPRIILKNFANIEIPYIPIKEQDKIVAVLKAIDDKIENNNKINAELESMAKTIYDYWFLQFDFPDENGKPYKSSGGKMVWNEELKREIPEGWKYGFFADILNELECGNRPQGGVSDLSYGIPSIGAENINGIGKYDFSSEKYISEEYFNSLKKGIIKSNDVLIYKDGAGVGQVSMAKNGFPHQKCAVNSHVFIARTKENNLFQNYLYFTLEKKHIKKILINLAMKAAQPGLNQPSVESVPILIPSNEIIAKFNNTVEVMVDKIFSNVKENKELSSLRDFLLPLLMNGQVGFKDLESVRAKEISLSKEDQLV
ncbi:restriction endonuclease subunit S [uncultured Clostridium sp.]|uniref:restriction endonuclease subunit S n=1 Tax=uncultured Clostridium sp. TaxID=59620 RepID=UPI0025DF979C|nr:restriction endonuclease subunit S [uncultured Clostridium sp.]